MIGHDGNTIDAIRELVSVLPKIECALLAFAWAHPEKAAFIEKSLKFRCRVLEEFDRLVRKSVRLAICVKWMSQSRTLLRRPTALRRYGQLSLSHQVAHYCHPRLR